MDRLVHTKHNIYMHGKVKKTKNKQKQTKQTNEASKTSIRMNIAKFCPKFGHCTINMVVIEQVETHEQEESAHIAKLPTSRRY